MEASLGATMRSSFFACSFEGFGSSCELAGGVEMSLLGALMLASAGVGGGGFGSRFGSGGRTTWRKTSGRAGLGGSGDFDDAGMSLRYGEDGGMLRSRLGRSRSAGERRARASAWREP